MCTVGFAPQAKRQIAKLEASSKQAIKNFLKDKVAAAKDKKGLYEVGGTELVGNLKGLWRFKSSDFKRYRVIGYLEDDTCIRAGDLIPRRVRYKNGITSDCNTFREQHAAPQTARLLIIAVVAVEGRSGYNKERRFGTESKER